jgi:hypothetical protein
MSSPAVAWWRFPTISPAAVLTFLPACDCLTSNSLIHPSTLNSTPVQLSQLLLVLASTVVIGFDPRRDLWPLFVLFRLMCASKWGPLFEGFDYYRSLLLYRGVTLLSLTLTHSLLVPLPLLDYSSVQFNTTNSHVCNVGTNLTESTVHLFLFPIVAV